MNRDSSLQDSLLPSLNSKFLDYDQLKFVEPGTSQRKKRSVLKLCLWLSGIIVIVLVSLGVWKLGTKVLMKVRNPHGHMYYDEKGKGGGEPTDWSQVVKPMMTKDSKFDVVASVWIRDDNLVDSEKDAVAKVDGEERPEKLIFTGKVFENVDAKSNMKFANVDLRIPTNHFKHANLSNYDLRASFVLVQSNENRPSWLDFAMNFTTWKPQSLESLSVRKHDADLTLEDKIYDSFGISIPLIQFHNIGSKRPGNIDNTSLVKKSATVEDTTPFERESEFSWDGEANWDEEEADSALTAQINQGGLGGRNSFKLEFIGGKHPVTEYHPYVVTRTHLHIMKQDRLFKRLPYIIAQSLVANRTCVKSSGKLIQNPEWYQCHKNSLNSGVFETKIRLRLPSSLGSTGTINDRKQWKTEWLYAPYMSATHTATGPKDIVPIPVDRENFPQTETEYTTVNWKLSFSSHRQEKFLLFDAQMYQGHVYNMTETEPLLQNMQHEHDLNVGIFGHRIGEDAHPRRIIIRDVISVFIRLSCWLLVIHYWYTRTTTTGISRLGTILISLWPLLDTLEGLLILMFSHVLPSFFAIDSIRPFLMLVAVMRLECSWSTRKKGGKKKWIPRVHMAKATHSERASERTEARLPQRVKLMLFITIFIVAHFFITPKSYLLSPTIELSEVSPHPLELFLPQVPLMTRYLQTLGVSSFLTGCILQFVMNYSSQTYAGNYKITTLLWLISAVIALLDLIPSFAGTTLRTDGVTVIEGITLVIEIMDLVQAVKYRYAKSLDEEDED
ncbi:hypothetical protein Agabi119p4_10117 [Agaricus bisporus var. burnettii]|uniref:Uncharacterized protein n=1 Tax=Agaricus bisporus var. burnettii TaxID=192524 RepID=A0A8H7C1X4_AGABI|nr:hypothetical protein Agabi119p4_10117 [Agaricus bisporus var. burnettii]